MPTPANRTAHHRSRPGRPPGRVAGLLVVVSALALGTAPAAARADSVANSTRTATTGSVAVRYRYVPIAPLGSNEFGTYAAADDVNSSGQVVGYSSTAQSNHAFVWTAGHTLDLGTLGGDSTDPVLESQARAVNADGVVVGSSQLDGPGDTGQHAFRWADGVFTDLGTGYADHRSGSYANDVNDHGTVVGVHYARQDAPQLAVMWTAGRLTTLPGLGGPGGPYATISEATAVNANGVVAGDAQPPHGALHAVTWTNGKIRDLGNLGGTTEATQAFALDDVGTVVGTSQTPDGAFHAYRWKNGVMTDLGALPVDPANNPYAAAYGINGGGTIVGLSRITPDRGRTITAVVWHGTRPVDLNTLVDGLPTGRRLELASAVSDDGRIVGRSCVPARCQQTPRAFVLVPIS